MTRHAIFILPLQKSKPTYEYSEHPSTLHLTATTAMSFLAGPSRAATRNAIPRSTLASFRSVRHITIPHPDTIPPPDFEGGQNFVINVSTRIHDMVHALACVRAAEKALGSPVISIDIYRDYETLNANSFIQIVTLKPVEYTGPIHLSIVPPLLTTSTRYGGPSLADVEAALASPPREAMGEEAAYEFRVELSRNPIRAKKAVASARIPSTRRAAVERENVKILDALENLGGEWEKIAQRWDHLRPLTPSGPYQKNRNRSSIVDELASDNLEDQIDSDTARQQRRDQKHRFHDRQPDNDSKPSEDTEQPTTLEEMRNRSKQERELRHQQRLDRQAERQAEIDEKAASQWKFDLQAKVPEVPISELKLAPRSSPGFSVRQRAPKAPVTDVALVDEDDEAFVAAARAEAEKAREAARVKSAQEEKRAQQAAKQKRMKQLVQEARRDVEAKRLTEKHRAKREEMVLLPPEKEKEENIVRPRVIETEKPTAKSKTTKELEKEAGLSAEGGKDAQGGVSGLLSKWWPGR